MCFSIQIKPKLNCFDQKSLVSCKLKRENIQTEEKYNFFLCLHLQYVKIFYENIMVFINTKICF